MGQSVYSQCDRRKYFSLYTIDEEQMRANGLKMTVEELRDLARKRPYYSFVYTGSTEGRQRKTPIYRYADFKDEKINIETEEIPELKPAPEVKEVPFQKMVKELMLFFGFSQRQFAELFEVPEASVSRWLNGKSEAQFRDYEKIKKEYEIIKKQQKTAV